MFETALKFIYAGELTMADMPPGGTSARVLAGLCDTANRLLLFPLKRHVALTVMPRLRKAALRDICNCLLVADQYQVCSRAGGMMIHGAFAA